MFKIMGGLFLQFSINELSLSLASNNEHFLYHIANKAANFMYECAYIIFQLPYLHSFRSTWYRSSYEIDKMKECHCWWSTFSYTSKWFIKCLGWLLTMAKKRRKFVSKFSLACYVLAWSRPCDYFRNLLQQTISFKIYRKDGDWLHFFSSSLSLSFS